MICQMPCSPLMLICLLMTLNFIIVIVIFFTVEHTLQADLENISIWLIVNRLKQNVSKSHCMLIGSRQRTGGKCLHLMLNGDVLRQVSMTKYLDVHIDQHLTWNTHITYMLNRIRSKLLLY